MSHATALLGLCLLLLAGCYDGRNGTYVREQGFFTIKPDDTVEIGSLRTGKPVVKTRGHVHLRADEVLEVVIDESSDPRFKAGEVIGTLHFKNGMMTFIDTNHDGMLYLLQ